MKTLIGISLLALLAGCSGPNKSELDAEVKRLCAIDGGVKVYETVTLSAERFDEHGNVKIPAKDYVRSGDEYYREWVVTYLRKGNPELARDHFKIIRRSDGKVLGEAIYYARRGGDLPGPWHDSSFACPEVGSRPSLEQSIFIIGNAQ